MSRKTRVSDGARTRDNRSHNPRGKETYRDVRAFSLVSGRKGIRGLRTASCTRCTSGGIPALSTSGRAS